VLVPRERLWPEHSVVPVHAVMRRGQWEALELEEAFVPRMAHLEARASYTATDSRCCKQVATFGNGICRAGWTIMVEQAFLWGFS